MNQTFLRFATASLALSFMGINVNLAQAATITYDVEVSIDSGILLNETYSGSFSFDDSTLTGVDSEFLPIVDLSFDFLGVNYSQADDVNSIVEFFDGDFLGLSFSPDPSFSFAPGFFAADEAFFSYDLPQGSGAGDVNYTLTSSSSSTSTPEPTSAIALLGLATLTWTFSRLKRTSDSCF